MGSRDEIAALLCAYARASRPHPLGMALAETAAIS